MTKTLRLVLGDQLNSQHFWFTTPDPSLTYLMMEMRQETDYVTHHIQKVVGFFLSMRNFAKDLQEQGHQVRYLTLDDPQNLQDLSAQIHQLVKSEEFKRFEYLLPDEYRLDEQLRACCGTLGIHCEAVDTEHFLTSRGFLQQLFVGKKTYLMETFYREMRKKYTVLMDGKDPIAGQWNFDQDNRKALKDKSLLKNPRLHPKQVHHITQMLEASGVKCIGNLDPDNFYWPTSREESLEVLHYFCEELLANFGNYQDALTTWDPYLFHSRLSFSLNSKMLSPLEVIQAVEAYWREYQKEVGLAQVEGFIRQILGWREYMRGIYWAKMPEFARLNYFGHERKLPNWFWTGKTKMNCLHQSITQSLDLAYAHHIQRLMVTGNFTLLAGIHPDEVDRWYLGIYIDAIEWVEITNTRGMSQFADGGIVGTKPYVSSANYIKKQGNYCSSCAYQAEKKTGTDACPFNSLYWHFHARNRELLEKNPRIGMVYRTWDKMSNQQELVDQAEYYLEHLEEL
ncbi:MAG: cryptochrome/photolyase family protein [Bacteroidetes bacterium]|nr:cryptochrome/photolyase family protein [Bacteroidota bacterium]MDA1267643.1 cryptochrome/photolyase family protein [Bacteroidota bacterium]